MTRCAPLPLPADGKYIWGSHLYPWDIAENGQRFVREHLRMQDTLVYIRYAYGICGPGQIMTGLVSAGAGAQVLQWS